jgi:SOS-response transcriptional repressor LexA
MLSVAVTAQQKLQSALDGLQRVRDELCDVESHLAISDAVGKWDYAKQAAEHEKVAGSLTEPSERFDTECQQALPRVKDAVDSTWPLALPSYASQAGKLGPIYAAAAQLASQSADLLARAGQASDVLRDRTEQVGSNYEEPGSRLVHAHAVLQKAQRMAGSLHEGLSGHQSGGRPAAPPASPAPDPEPPAAATQPASQSGRHLAPVVGRVSASGISRGIGLPTEERVPVPPRYAERHGIYAVQVDGDSMAAAGVLDGDYLTVLPASGAEDGEMVVAVFGGESDTEGVVKWLRRPEGSPAYLESPDPADTENLRKAGEFRIQGKVVGVVRWSIKRLS